MRILFHSWEFGQSTGGIGQYLYQMALAVDSFGHEVVVVAGADGGLKNSFLPKTIKNYGIYGRDEVRSAKVADAVLKITQLHRIDVIEGTDHWGECDKLLNVSDRPKIIIKYHSCQYLQKLSEVSSYYWWQRYVIRAAAYRIRDQIKAEKNCVENADAATAPSERILMEYARQGAHLPSRVAVIPNMITEVPVYERSTSSRPTLLFVGRLEMLKGIEYLPRILAEVKLKVPDVILEIAGSDQYARGLGSLKKWLEKRFGVATESVRFLGHLSWIELQEAYKRCWILIFPSKWDNFPMTVLEAMAYGIPIVTTPCGGMAEMLSGTSAPVHEPESENFSLAIIELLTNERMRLQIGEAVREKITSHYTPSKVVPNYLNFLQKCL